MDDIGNTTRVSSGRPAASAIKPARAVISIERRMGRAVEGEKINLLFGNQMLVGRDKTCEIFQDDDRISRKHALLRIDPDAVRLSDLGSTNGTTRNGEQVTEEIIVETGDVIVMGRSKTYEVRIVHRNEEISSVRLASGTDAWLLVPQEFIIGFAGKESEDIDFKIYDPKILPRHARIEYFTGVTFLVSLDPDNPVVINSSPVRELELRSDSLIEIGDTLLRYERVDG